MKPKDPFLGPNGFSLIAAGKAPNSFTTTASTKCEISLKTGSSKAPPLTENAKIKGGEEKRVTPPPTGTKSKRKLPKGSFLLLFRLIVCYCYFVRCSGGYMIPSNDRGVLKFLARYQI